ncbi:MAG: phytoene/squalene synthase family protein [Rhodobacteraceae bacterium]|nr:phytoene/squalene synthase family protein [Paracoccaceae bacterium]
MNPEDIAHCRDAIRHGSLSFHAASRLLPRRVRDPALALYAFCRLADDEVDLRADKSASVLRLRDRLERVYEGRPFNAAPDRAFAALVDAIGMPRALPEALLEGLAWDAMGRRYATLSDLRAYSARVASAVGAMMCVLMGVRERHALARACDLGLAMQLTNIARDIGEDAREGRLYLPTDWFDEAGTSAEAFLSRPRATPDIREMAARLLREADRYYHRSEAGVALLPADCRAGILAARYIYAAIGQDLRAAGFDSVTRRAHTSTRQKLGWLTLAGARTAGTFVMPRSALLYARPAPEVAFLVEAAADGAPQAADWSDKLHDAFAQLAARDAARRNDLIELRRRVR